MATIKDIARLSGYSIGTVSRVINHHPDVSAAARKKIEQVIKEQNFQPNSNAKQLKQQNSTAIHVIVRGYENTFFEGILEHIQSILRVSGEEVAVTFVDEFSNEVQAAIQLSASIKPKGFIFLGGNIEYFKADFEQIKVPCVLLTNTAMDLGFDNLSSYCTDDYAASYDVICRFIEQGHKEIGIIGGAMSNNSGQVGYRRLNGSMKAFKDNDLSFDEYVQYQPSRFTLAGGYEAAQKLLQRNPNLTAIYAIGDTIAIGAIRAIKDMGLRIPEDISVIGFDGLESSRYTVPRLATVHQNTDILARKGVEDILLRLNYSQPSSHEMIPYDFISGESLGACKE